MSASQRRVYNKHDVPFFVEALNLPQKNIRVTFSRWDRLGALVAASYPEYNYTMAVFQARKQGSRFAPDTTAWSPLSCTLSFNNNQTKL